MVWPHHRENRFEHGEMMTKTRLSVRCRAHYGLRHIHKQMSLELHQPGARLNLIVLVLLRVLLCVMRTQ